MADDDDWRDERGGWRGAGRYDAARDSWQQSGGRRYGDYVGYGPYARREGTSGRGWRDDEDYGRRNQDSYRGRDRDDDRYGSGFDKYGTDNAGTSRGAGYLSGTRRDYDRDGNRYGSGSGRYGTGTTSTSRGTGYSTGTRRDYDRDGDRGFLDRAGDEVASWFGDDDAEYRRRMDARRDANERYYRQDSGDRLTGRDSRRWRDDW